MPSDASLLSVLLLASQSATEAYEPTRLRLEVLDRRLADLRVEVTTLHRQFEQQRQDPLMLSAVRLARLAAYRQAVIELDNAIAGVLREREELFMHSAAQRLAVLASAAARDAHLQALAVEEAARTAAEHALQAEQMAARRRIESEQHAEAAARRRAESDELFDRDREKRDQMLADTAPAPPPQHFRRNRWV